MNQHISSAEDTLLDYAVRLTHHRAGRKALFLRLTALAPETRTGNHWKLLDSVLGPLVLRHGGEFFRLRCGDAVVVFGSLDLATADRLTAKLSSLFRDDPLIERAPKPSGEPEPGALPVSPLCLWWDLGLDYDGFLALARRIKEAADDEAGPRSAFDGEVPEAEDDPLKPQRGPSFVVADPKTLPLVTWLQAPARGTTGLAALARVATIVRWEHGTAPIRYGEIMERHAQAQQSLGVPAGDLERNPGLAESLGTWIDRRILTELAAARPASSVLTVCVRLEALLGPEFLAFHRDWAVGSWVPVTWLVPVEDAEGPGYRYAREFLKRSGHRLGVSGVALDEAVDIDWATLKPDTIAFAWTPSRIPEADSRASRRLQTWLVKDAADLALLTGCDTLEATNGGRALGFSRLAGRHAENLVRGAAAAR